MLTISCAAYALLLALLIGHWANIHTFSEGAIMGAVVGILVATMTGTYWYSASHLFNGFAPLLADIAAAGLTVGIMGGTIGSFMGYAVKI